MEDELGEIKDELYKLVNGIGKLSDLKDKLGNLNKFENKFGKLDELDEG